MTNWKEYKLGDLVTFQRGHDLPRTEMKDGIYPVAGSNSIIGFHNEFTTNSPGITIGRSGNIGNPQLHKTNFWAHNTVLYVKEFKKVDPIFFFYLLKTLDFTQLNSGSAVPSLNRNFIHPFKVSVPEDLPTQTAIAEILSSLDDKIELNNLINQELENLAQTLFKQWFIDFEFPNENGEPYKSSGGKMVDSELGEIPKGWEVKQLKEILTIKRGGSPRPIQDFIAKSGLPWVKISDATSLKSPFLFSTKEFIKPAGLKKTILMKKGSLVLSNSATPGLPIFLELDACIHDGWLHFQDIKSLTYNYLYLFFKEIRQDLIGQGNGSIFINLKTDILKDYKTPIPEYSIISSFENTIAPIFEEIKLYSTEINELTNLRDLILPKLISGEFEVADVIAEKA
jgi:type I restriction enzyme S subunit